MHCLDLGLRDARLIALDAEPELDWRGHYAPLSAAHEAQPKSSFCEQTLFNVEWPDDPRQVDHTPTDPVDLSTLPLCNTGANGGVERGSGGGAARDQIER